MYVNISHAWFLNHRLNKAELKEQAKKFVKLFGGTGLPDFLFDETMRYIVGTAIVLCHGSVHPTAGLFIGSIKNGMGTNIMHSQVRVYR